MNDLWRIQYGIPEPKTKEEHKEVATIEGMRRAIFKASRDVQLVRMVEETAAYTGLSGEDKYVMLAYHALVQLEIAQQMNLKFLDLSPIPIVLPDTAGESRE